MQFGSGPHSAQVKPRTTRRKLVTGMTAAGICITCSAGCLGTSRSEMTAGSGDPSTTDTRSAGSTTNRPRRTVTDATGRNVTLPGDIEDVVAVGPGSLNLVCYLDAVDMVVGVEQNERGWGTNIPYNVANPELRDKPIIGPHRGGDPELITEADPDVILATYVTAGSAENLQDAVERPVVVVKAKGHPLHRVEGFYSDLAFVGDVIGRADRAKTVIEFVRSEKRRLNELTEDVQVEERVFLAGRSDTGGASVTSTQHPFAPFEFVDAENVADSISGHATVSEEKLLAWDPDAIFISESNLERVKQALSKSSYQVVTAIEKENLYGLLPSRFYGDLYGSVLANAYYVGSVLYEASFADVDPKVRADRIYEQLLGSPVYEELADQFGGFTRVSLE